MKTKQIILIVIIFLSMINVVSASGNETYNQTLIWSSTSSFNDWSSYPSSTNTGSLFSPVLSYIKIDMTNYKQINFFQAHEGMGWYAGGINYYFKRASFNISATDIITKTVPVTITVNGQLYGYGDIGWQKYPASPTSTDYIYLIQLTYLNFDYLNTLTGLQNLSLNYDTTVYSSYIDNYNVNCGGGCGDVENNPLINMYSINGKVINVGVATNTYYYLSYGKGTLAFFNYSGNSNSTLDNYGNVSFKSNGYNFYSDIYDEFGNKLYDAGTGTYNWYQNISKLNGTIVNIKLISSGLWINTTLYHVLPNISTIESYNISFNKSSYNLNVDVEFNANITNFDNNSAYYILFTQEPLDGCCIYQNYPITSSGNTIYPQIDKTKVSSIYAQIMKYNPEFKNYDSVYTSNAIPYGMVDINTTAITGNITLDKSEYSLGENINIKYNSSVSGQIIIQCENILYSENINSGNNLQTNYTISNLELLPCAVKLQYYNSNIRDWITLDYKLFSTIQAIDNVFFSKTYVSLGEQIDVYYNSQGNRILTLKDSSGNIKFSYNVSQSSYGLSKSYILTSSDLTGNYTAYLNYTNNTVITSAIINVMDAIIIPSTTTSISSQPNLLDFASDLSIAVIGDFDRDTKGDITDEGVKKKGDKALPFLILVVFIILIMGTYHKVKGK